MRKNNVTIIALALIVQVVIPGATCQVRAQVEKAPYPAMAPPDQYLMPDENSEIALARSAAPATISDGAEVMVLGTEWIYDRGEGQQWFSLYCGAITGRRHR